MSDDDIDYDNYDFGMPKKEPNKPKSVFDNLSYDALIPVIPELQQQFADNGIMMQQNQSMTHKQPPPIINDNHEPHPFQPLQQHGAHQFQQRPPAGLIDLSQQHQQPINTEMGLMNQQQSSQQSLQQQSLQQQSLHNQPTIQKQPLPIVGGDYLKKKNP